MILVVGATGRLGGEITHRLARLGRPLRALVRTDRPDGLGDLPGLEMVLGDLKNKDSLARACDGVDMIISTANSTARGGDDTIDSVDRMGYRNLIDVAERSAVRRFTFISALGADRMSPMPLLRAKGETEEVLRNSTMSWTIVQPNLYMDLLVPMAVGIPALTGKTVTLVGEGRRRHSMVAMNDVASYVIAAIDKGPDKETLRVGGPEPVSWRDVVQAFERELGRSIKVASVPLGHKVPDLPDFVSELLTALETYDSRMETASLAARYSVSPTTLAEFVHAFVTTSSPARLS